ncbi:YhgE/Pip domain-containing protein [Neobacillus mesonae]|uniref:YhgE/Pip domain-containing protein n=1 Tax=Neobacillus mesonae TaxID=1193713 RepID=UPI00203EB8B3|nr:YhgE/Pip domain-containing protein [Neobacillus mesonae]MCM3567820.1 YhgE/Pip domain-containing protein [Neobacillus mesonae]
MKKVFSIYRNDLLSLTTNWAAAFIIAALIILPSLYAWFNIKASWDPYSNTKEIPIAIVNNDKGAELKGESINIGEEILDSLKKNHSLGWKFVSSSEAVTGVKTGKYFASITIPSDFSAKIGTVLNDNPEKPELLYTVNEKINAIAPKITSKGASGIKEEVSKNFVKTANGVIFDIFNRLGIELQKNLPDIEKLKSMIFWLEQHLNEAESMINTANDNANQAQKIVNDLQKNIDKVEGIIKHARGLSGQISSFLESNKESIANLAPAIKQNLTYMEAGAQSVEQITSLLSSDNISNTEKQQALNDAFTQLTELIKIETLLIDLFDQLNHLAGNTMFSNEIANVTEQKNRSQRLLQNVKRLKMTEALSPVLIKNTNQLAKNLSTDLGQIGNSYDSKTSPKIKNFSETAKSIPIKADNFFSKADETLPQIKKILNDTSKGIAIGKRDLALIKRDFPEIKQKITTLANQIREFEKSEDIREIIDLLRNDVKKESDFFADPVLLKEKRLFPIPNYGSAMSPFFTTLSLWVGATLLISLIPVEVADLPKDYQPHHIYLGRLLTFLSIALCQSMIVTLGDIYLLKTYIAAKLCFFMFGLLISAVFMLIVYTLVSILGNVGKGLAIVILVLQISASGGTFPVQVMPVFFQQLNPYLPFTYAISMMREAVGGILWEVVKTDLLILFFITIVTLLFGLVLKKPIEKYGRAIKKKAKESRLIH